MANGNRYQLTPEEEAIFRSSIRPIPPLFEGRESQYASLMVQPTREAFQPGGGRRTYMKPDVDFTPVISGEGYGRVLTEPLEAQRYQVMLEEEGVSLDDTGFTPEEARIITAMQRVRRPNGDLKYIVTYDPNTGTFDVTERALGSVPTPENTKSGLSLDALSRMLEIDTADAEVIEATKAPTTGTAAGDEVYHNAYGSFAWNSDLDIDGNPIGFMVITEDNPNGIPVGLEAQYHDEDSIEGQYYAMLEGETDRMGSIPTPQEVADKVRQTGEGMTRLVERTIAGASGAPSLPPNIYATETEARAALMARENPGNYQGYVGIREKIFGGFTEERADAVIAQKANPAGWKKRYIPESHKYVVEEIEEEEPTGEIFGTQAEAVAAAPPGWEAVNRGDGFYILQRSAATPDMGLQQAIEQRVLSGDLEGARQLYNAWQGVTEGRVSIRDAASIVSNIATNPAEFKYLLDAMRGPDDLVAPRDPRYDKDLIEAMASFDARGFAGAATVPPLAVDVSPEEAAEVETEGPFYAGGTPTTIRPEGWVAPTGPQQAQPGSTAWWVLENARYQREKAEYEQQMAARQAALLKYGSQWSAAPFGGGYAGLGSVRTPYADTGARQAALRQGMLQGPGVTFSDEEARTFDEMQVGRSLMQHQNLLSKPRSGRTGAKLFV